MQSTFDVDSLDILKSALERLGEGFAHLPPTAPPALDRQLLAKVLLEVAERLHNNYPYFHPLYAGQMLKPPHPVARLAAMLAMWINPNNHASTAGAPAHTWRKKQ